MSKKTRRHARLRTLKVSTCRLAPEFARCAVHVLFVAALASARAALTMSPSPKVRKVVENGVLSRLQAAIIGTLQHVQALLARGKARLMAGNTVRAHEGKSQLFHSHPTRLTRFQTSTQGPRSRP